MITPLHIDLQVCSGSEYRTPIFTVSVTKQITLGKRFTIVTTTKIGSTTKERTITLYPILLVCAGNFGTTNSIIYNCFTCIALTM